MKLITECILIILIKKNYEYFDIVNNQVRLSGVASGYKISDTLLLESVNSAINNKWVTLSLLRSKSKSIFKIAGKTIYSIANKGNKKGCLGFGVINGEILVDNIAYYTENNSFFKTNFHEETFDFINELPEHTTDYIDRFKKRKLTWYVMKGYWEGIGVYNEYVTEAIYGKSKNNDDAIIITGDEFASGYTFGSAIRSKDDNGIGLCFNFQDSINYYVFKWTYQNSFWNIQLLKVENGAKVLISEKAWKAYSKNTWYKLEIKLNKRFIYASIDDEVVLEDTLDNTLVDGRVGLWTSSVNGTYFDDIYMLPTEIKEPSYLNTYQYTFVQNKQIALDFCDWTPSNVDMIKYLRVDRVNARPYIDKQFLEDSYLTHKKIISKNFILSVSENNYIPKDVNLFFKFISYKDGISNLYYVGIENNEVKLMKNGSIIDTYSEFQDMGTMKISHINNVWEIKNNDNILIKYMDRNIFDGIKIESGAGIGKAKLPIKPIIIEEVGE